MMWFLILIEVSMAMTLIGAMENTMVKTGVGRIKGRVVTSPQGIPVEEYLGIPYAVPPVGDLRYADPVQIDHLPSDPYSATHYKSVCMQFKSGGLPGSDMFTIPNAVSEDCLYLNVWAPKHTHKNKKIPVMVRIPGGSFISGSNSQPVHDGKALAAHGEVIVVAMNYRIGSLGFLSTGDGRINGNFGMKDQVKALQWVKENIESFGGDPDSVTLFGDSAGAASVGLHMMSNQSQHLFHRVIMESGTPTTHWAFMDHEQAKTRSAVFLNSVNCEQQDVAGLLTCLRTLPPEEIIANQWVVSNFLEFPWLPTVDGWFLVDTPHNLVQHNRYSNKDTLLGVTQNEGTILLPIFAVPGIFVDQPSLQTYEMFRKNIDVIDWDLSNNQRAAIKTEYSPADRSDEVLNRDSLSEVCTDRSFLCPAKELVDIFSGEGRRIYFYYLTHRASNNEWLPWYGVVHDASAWWIVGMPLNETLGYTEQEIDFSRIIMSYWTNFAKTGDPNQEDLPVWQGFTQDTPRYIEFRGVPSQFYTNTELRDEYCEFWEGINVETSGSE